MKTFWFFRLRFCRVYDSAYDSDFRFSLGHKRSYSSVYDSVAGENQPKRPSWVWPDDIIKTLDHLAWLPSSLLKLIPRLFSSSEKRGSTSGRSWWNFVQYSFLPSLVLIFQKKIVKTAIQEKNTTDWSDWKGLKLKRSDFWKCRPLNYVQKLSFA